MTGTLAADWSLPMNAYEKEQNREIEREEEKKMRYVCTRQKGNAGAINTHVLCIDLRPIGCGQFGIGRRGH